MAAALSVTLAAGCGGSDGAVIANHRVEIEATDDQGFSIDDEAAFAAEVEKSVQRQTMCASAVDGQIDCVTDVVVICVLYREAVGEISRW